MWYWIKVILEESKGCGSCGGVLNYGDVAYVFKEDLAKDTRVRCPFCMQKAFPCSAIPGALSKAL